MNRLPVKVAKFSIAFAFVLLTAWTVAASLKRGQMNGNPAENLQKLKDAKLRQEVISKWPEYARIVSSDPQFKEVLQDFKQGFAALDTQSLSEEERARYESRFGSNSVKEEPDPKIDRIEQTRVDVTLPGLLMRFNDQITNSGLRDDEKYAATQLLLSLMRDAVAEEIAATTVQKLHDAEGTLLHKESVNDQDIRNFVDALSTSVTETSKR